MVTRAAGKCCGGPVIEKPHAVPGGIDACGKNWGKIVRNLAQPEKNAPISPKTA